ncbi:MAG TPA: hypothetical protein VHC41_10000 [Mycobacteriales bacterium]|jgi:hypothetical protein|nr:hypothetical protein [Mycobacteriales bacterium]
MAEVLPARMRVLVKGASMAVWISDMGGPRTDFAFPRRTEAALRQAGIDADVRTSAIPAEWAKKAIRCWQQEVLAWSPDVVVLLYGHVECIHFLLPWRLERHANSLLTRPGRWREAYRKLVMGPLWMALVRTQARADAALSSRRLAHRARLVVADLERYITRTKQVGSPLVLVMDIVEPGPRWQSWFPGMPARVAVMNRALADMVERIGDPNVKLFRTTEVASEYRREHGEPTPDGGHFTPELHALIGDALAREIGAWAATQPHVARAQLR